MSALSFLLKQIADKQKRGILGEEIYFRGQHELQELIPSLLRKDRHYKKPLEETENNFFCDAWVMGTGELAQTRNSWEALAVFQHYEIPTRLLDWSSSLPNALFFALTRCLGCDQRGGCKRLRKSCEGNPVIWVLDPGKMHAKLHADKPVAEMDAITVGVDSVQDYKDQFVVREASVNSWEFKAGPVFLQIPWTNARMRSQKGFFTFHYSDQPLERLLDEASGLVRIVLTKRERGDVVAEFNALGINEHDVFTDLVSLANYFKRRYANN